MPVKNVKIDEETEMVVSRLQFEEMVKRVEAMEAKVKMLSQQIQQAQAETREADSNYGAAMRKVIKLEQANTANSQWIANAVREAGFNDGVKFTDIWRIVLAGYNANQAAVAKAKSEASKAKGAPQRKH